MNALDLGSRLQLFVDGSLIAALRGAELRLHEPQPQPLARSPLTGGYVTVIKDGALFRGYYRDYTPGYAGPFDDGNAGEITCYAESVNGHEWARPDPGLYPACGTPNAILAGQAPFSHNFSPFLDTRPGVDPRERFKALAGNHPGGGLCAFASADGVRWSKLREAFVLTSHDFAFDSQNVSFWSEAEGCYVCVFRSWQTPHGRLRTLSRSTSPDFVNWSTPVALAVNLPDEHLYTSQTHQYFREPSWLIALPTRFVPARGESTEILFMAARAGQPFARLFKEAFIRPGFDPARWGNRANYAALNVVPTADGEMSIYHAGSGRRYTLRTDGFISVRGPFGGGEMLTQPFVISGDTLRFNISTSATGQAQVELRDSDGRALPGFGVDDCAPIVTDSIAHHVTWTGGRALRELAGRVVHMRGVLHDADLYSFQCL